MTRPIPRLLLALFACSLLACIYQQPYHSGGPPPHAPAHGYRAKQAQDVAMRFDPTLGLNLVVGYPNYYFHQGQYFRLSGGAWQISSGLDGPWEACREDRLPPGLRKKQGSWPGNGSGNSPGNSGNKGKGNGNGKNR